MISSLLCETCTILRRQEDSRDAYNKYSYSEITNVPCLGLRSKNDLPETDFARTSLNEIVLFTVEEVFETDKIVYDGYEYDLTSSRYSSGNVENKKDIVSGKVEYYMTHLERRVEYPSTSTSITKLTKAGGRQ
jgi:hypothetical protein